MNIFNLTLSIGLPEPANLEQIKEWVDFQTCKERSMSINNPLVDIDLKDLLTYDNGLLKHDVVDLKLTK
ncbi:MAG: hypothetical protein EOP41_06430 [Sphingobacteriaceae bacterium]|nr:MAG: hypothetical protein EOP41_06430 [Sphingobacteriaceae bacterium]